jgi:hypothetical protein
MGQMATAFEHFDDVHPHSALGTRHSALKMKLPGSSGNSIALPNRVLLRSSRRYIANSPWPEMRGKSINVSNGSLVPPDAVIRLALRIERRAQCIATLDRPNGEYRRGTRSCSVVGTQEELCRQELQLGRGTYHWALVR